MKHVAPYRWADADAGRLSPGELAELENHADNCPRCAATVRAVCPTLSA